MIDKQLIIKISFFLLSLIFTINSIILRILEDDKWFSRFSFAIICLGIFFILDSNKMNKT
jgi:hypothetical protein